MIPSDRKAFSKLLLNAAGVFGRDLDNDTVSAYFHALRSLPIAAIARALEEIIATAQFFPKPGEIRSLITAPDDPQPQWRDGNWVYLCSKCLDTGIVMAERKDSKGRSMGIFGSPCECKTGNTKRERWKIPDSQGKTVEETARRNAAAIERRQRETPE